MPTLESLRRGCLTGRGARLGLLFAALLLSPASNAQGVGGALIGQPGCEGREYIYHGGRLLAVEPTLGNVSVSFVSSGASFPESGSATATVVLSTPLGPLGCPVSVAFATFDGEATATDGDFTPVSGSVTFDAGSANGATRTISVPIAVDTRYEGNESFTIQLSSPAGAVLGAIPVFTATIVNDDPVPTISIADVTLEEGSAGTTWIDVKVTLSNPSARPITVNWATADGTAKSPGDYAAAADTLTVSPGSTSGTARVTIVADTAYEGDEDFFVNLSGASGGTIGDSQARVTLVEDDLPAATISDVHLLEGNTRQTRFTFAVMLQGPSHQKVSVSYQTADCSAVQGVDYLPASGTLDFPANGVTTRTFDVLVLTDTVAEPMKSFDVVLSNPIHAVFGRNVGHGSILDDDSPAGASRRSDFNQDGRNDLLFADATTGNLQAWFLNGDLRLDKEVALVPPKPASGNWRVVAVNDFNRDGKPDLLFRNDDSGNLVFWLMDGVARTGAATLSGETGLQWKVVGSGDFTGDGKPDLLYRRDDTGELSVWVLDDTALASKRPAVPPAPADGAVWAVGAVGDLNGDGKADILFRHSISGATTYWVMDGATRIGGGFLSPSTIKPEWTIASLVDVDLDGKADLLLHDAAQGELRVLYLDGTTERCETSVHVTPEVTLKPVGPR